MERSSEGLARMASIRARLTGNGNFDFRLRPSRKRRAARKSLAAAGDVFKDTAAHWAKFWSNRRRDRLWETRTDPRRAGGSSAASCSAQYLTAIQCSGTTPPQETGLTCNSWYGKISSRNALVARGAFRVVGPARRCSRRSLDWYSQILGSAKDRAKQQGYAGGALAEDDEVRMGAILRRRLGRCSSGSSRIRFTLPSSFTSRIRIGRPSIRIVSW